MTALPLPLLVPAAVLGTSTLATVTLTPLVRRLGLAQNLVDHPGTRKIHQQPVVRVGGIAIFAGTLAAWLVASASGGLSPLGLALLLGGLGFFATGLMDDLWALSPFLRLGLQAVISAGVWALGLRLDALPLPGFSDGLPPWLSLLVTFLWLAGMANAINWLDGMDGLAAGVSAIAAGVLAVGSGGQDPLLGLLAMGLAGSCMGFLKYNAAPAQIFMGDGGSYFLGFTLAALAATGLMADGTLTAAALPFAVLLVPVLDMALVIGARLSDRRSPFFPDQRHIHHRLMHGMPRSQVVGCIYGLTGLAGCGALVLPFSALGWGLEGVALVLLGCTTGSLWPRPVVEPGLPSAGLPSAGQ